MILIEALASICDSALIYRCRELSHSSEGTRSSRGLQMCAITPCTVLVNNYFLLWHHHLLIETLKQALVRILIVFMLVPG